ncbi:MAG: protein kinase [Myxococcota bacterium]|nr:protein kinase [Myxococcota bacterium]
MAPPPPIPDRTETLVPRSSTPQIEPNKETAPAEPDDIEVDDPDRYEQVAEHARGGLGRVVRAVDKRLGRTVAVKELLRRGEHGDSNEERFLREALITARLEHPGIVPVHEAGRWPNGDPYYVMKLVEGRTLKELISSRSQLRDRLSLLPHVIAIADAVGYAHSEGVIHRDLKPSNVIVGEFGETIVVDWGLAHDRKRDVPEPPGHDVVSLMSASGSHSTISGKVVGTPAYMAPEQARGETVDERADVYAIGAVLYELLAGRPPHHDETPQLTLDRVLAGPPRPVAAAVAHVPVELATIVSKAMSRLPDERYPNASALAEDLRRFQTGKLVSAHTYTTWSLLRKKLAQHRGVVAVAVASAIALGAVGVESFRRVVAERNIARSERGRAVISQSQAEKRQRELVLLQAVTSMREDPTATLAWLKDYRIADEDRAQVLELVDEALASGIARHVFRPGDWVFDAVFTPDGEKLLMAVRDGVLRIHDLRTGDETKLGQLAGQPEIIQITPDARYAVIAGSFGTITKWPLDGGPSEVIAKVGRTPVQLEMSRDGKSLLVLREAGSPEIVSLDGGPSRPLTPKNTIYAAIAKEDWSRIVVATARNEASVLVGEQTRSLARTEKAIQRLGVSPAGDTVLIWDGTVVWRVPFGGGKLEKLADFNAGKIQFVWSPDQQTVALAGDVRDIKLVDLATGKVRELRGHTDSIYTLQWTRDGRRLLSASDDGTARVWAVFDGTSIVLRGHTDDVYRARFSADETQVATSSLDGSARVWRIDQPGTRVLTEGDSIEDMWFHGDRSLVKTRSEVAWWNLSSGHRVPVFSREQGALSLGIPSPDGERLAVTRVDSSIEVRHKSGPPLILRGHTNYLSDIKFSRDHQWLFTSSFDGTLRRWDLATGQGTILVEGFVPVRNFALASDNRVAVNIGEKLVVISPSGEPRELGSGTPWCMGLKSEFEPVRERLLVRRCDSSFALIDGARVIELPTGGHHMMQTAVSPDGKQIAGAMSDRTLRIWDATTGNVLQVLRGHSDLPLDVAFSPDGTMLASSSYDKTVRIWQLGANRERVLRGHSGPIYHVSWLDAARITTGSRDGTIRIWDVPVMNLPTAAELANRIDAATSVRIDVDRPTTGSTTRRGT